MTSHRQPINIGFKGRRRRILIGSIGLMATIAVAIWMMVVGVDSLWRWALFLPLFASVLCVVEAKFSTCVILAALGAWDLGCGTQKVPDSGLETDLRSRALKIIGLSLGAALLATAIFVLLPCRHASCPKSQASQPGVSARAF